MSDTPATHELEEATEDKGVSVWAGAPTFRWESGGKTTAGVDTKGLKGEEVQHNFFRMARWCHDGTAVLTTAEDRVIRVYDSPAQDDEMSFGQARLFSQPDAIHAATWYPSASASSLETFCFMTGIRDSPVRLVDAVDGRVRATYPIVDHRERYISPHCLAFNPSGTKVYGGHENAIEVLDIANPGHDTSERLKTAFSRKEKGGQKGIISSLAFCPDYSGTYAAGTYSGSVSIYSEDTSSTPLQHLENVHKGGVTHLAFHPLSPVTLFVGSRRSSSIQVYDLRDTSVPVTELQREGKTNQRLVFDVDPWGRYLCSGDDEGTVKVWDISDLSREPIFAQKLHRDAVGSVQLHPFKPLLLSVSGSRAHVQQPNESRWNDSDTESSSSDDDENTADDDSDMAGSGDPSAHSFSPQVLPVADLGMRIWSFA